MFRSEEVDIKQYGVVLARWKRLILTVAGACMGLAFALNLVMQPVYRAVTRIEVNKEPTRSPITGELISDDFQSDNVALNTTAELMTNRGLLRQVARTLRERELLQMNAPRAEFFRHLRDRLAFHEADPASAIEGYAEESHISREVDWLLSILNIKPIRETRLVKVQVDHWNPRIAKAIADVVAAEFVDYQGQLRAFADTVRLGKLRHRIQDARGQISELETRVSTEAGMPVLEERVRQLGGSLSGLNGALVRAQTERLEVDARLSRLKRFMGDSLLAGGDLPVQSETLEGLWREVLTRQTELARAREVFREKHPRVLMLETGLRAIRENIRAETHKIVAALEAQRGTLVAQEQSLKSEIGSSEGRLRDVSGRIGQHTTLESQLRTRRDFYDLLSAKVQEGELISSGIRLPLVRVVEPATVGPDPVRPRKTLNLALGLVVGLFGGTGLALFLEYLRRAIRTPNDVMEHLQLPVLGMIPKRPQ